MEISTRESNGCLVVAVDVESVDYTVCDEFKQRLSKLAESSTGHKMLLNLEKVSFMDSMSIGALVAIKNILGKHNGTLGLCNLHPYVSKIVSVVTLNTIFDIYTTEAEALEKM